MSRSATDRRHKAKWPQHLPNQPSSTTTSTAFNRLTGVSRSTGSRLSQKPSLTEHSAPAIELMPEPHSSKPVQRKPVPRGPTERNDFSAVVDTLNQDRLTPGYVPPPYEPKSYFDWDSEEEDTPQVSFTFFLPVILLLLTGVKSMLN